MNLLNFEFVPFAAVNVPLSRAGRGDVVKLPLAEGRADAPQIIAALKQMTIYYGREPAIREFAVSLFPPSLGNNDAFGMARALSSFVRDRLTYVPDPPGTEYVVTPPILIERIMRDGYAHGDCDDHVLFFNSLAYSVGLDVNVAGVHLNDRVLWDHVISQVYLGGEWHDVDLCLKNGEVRDYDEKLVS